jgi:hypothetical protein
MEDGVRESWDEDDAGFMQSITIFPRLFVVRSLEE